MAPATRSCLSAKPVRHVSVGNVPDQALQASDRILFEACERRLVLSAQLLFDVLGDQALDIHTSAHNSTDSSGLQTHLQLAHQATGLDAVRADLGLTGAGQTVAVIDSGIAWDHVALGQGYGPGYRVVGGWDFSEENDNQPYDDGPTGFHGTHVSGIIGSDDPQHPGVAPDVDLVALRVFNDFGEGRLEWIENALKWVQANRDSFEHPITTVNVSVGTLWNGEGNPQWATLEDELQQLHASGIVITASAGNSFADEGGLGLSYPASSPHVLPVASVDPDGSLSDFSQRNERVLAAPGSNITSTIPDHVLGRDGAINDFTAASGTSMASPYVAGASVLVRQAMEMSGWESITADDVIGHLRTTSDEVFDTTTGLSFDVLNLETAINSLIPSDEVGDSASAAATLDTNSTRIDTWLNSTRDIDVYRFDASASGQLTIDVESEWVDSAGWEMRSQDVSLATGSLEPGIVEVVAGQTYELYVSGGSSIGPLSLNMSFVEAETPDGETNPTSGGSSPPPAVDLGAVQYAESSLAAGTGYLVTAARDGTFTVQWTNHDAAAGTLVVTDASGQMHQTADWTNGSARLDVQATAGDRLAISLPGANTDEGQLTLANVLSRTGSSATVTGTLQSDQLALDLSNGVAVTFGSVDYAFAPGQISILHLDGYGSNDQLDAVGSQRLDKVDLRPSGSSIGNQDVQVIIASIEEISYASGGGADRVYLYDSDTDDKLVARPGQAELVGVGYRFEVEGIQRIFIHATGAGQDIAYLYDSPGDDRLSLRPQFSSLSGDGFFNYVRGFERVHAYANAGGTDTAELYDSSQNDRFFTSGVSASMVGPGFSSFTRSFEQVNAHATAGGNDVADLYGSGGQTQWRQGSDFVSFHEAQWQREARGFSEVETFEAGLSTSIITQQVTAPTPAINPDPASLQPGSINPPADEAVSRVQLQPDHNTRSETIWESISIRERLTDKLHLPEASLMADQQLERDVLDEAFRQFDQRFEGSPGDFDPRPSSKQKA